MLYYDKIDLNKRINVAQSNKSKECFQNQGFKIQ